MTMIHPFNVLAPEYQKQVAAATILPGREKEVTAVCKDLLKNKAIYAELSARTPNGIPVAWLMAISQREMSGDLNRYLGNGQSLLHRTTIVPTGRGPFTQRAPEGFIAGALDALRLDEIDKVDGWSMVRAAYQGELWNGWGYRSKGIPSPYVFGATTVQRPGKYVRDHVYDSRVMDPQLGIIAIIEELIQLDPGLRFDAAIEKVDSPPIVPSLPVGIGGGINVFLLQQKLNALHVAGTPLKADGVYGRATTRAVKAYQFTRKLDVDGLVGPKTIAALAL